MAVIKEDFGYADSADHASGGGPSLALAMRDVADDLATCAPVELVEDDATDLASAILLVNEIKGMLNTKAAVAIKTTKG